MYVFAAMLGVGLICNGLVKPVDSKWFMSADELAEEKRLAHERAVPLGSMPPLPVGSGGQATNAGLVVLAWVAVGLALVWGAYRTLQSVVRLFN
jgi:hypothetical protein